MWDLDKPKELIEQVRELKKRNDMRKDEIDAIRTILNDAGLADIYSISSNIYGRTTRKAVENYNNTLKSRLDTLMKYLGLEEEVIKTVPEHTIIKKVRNKS